MRVADYIAQRCKELNEHVFMFVGGGAMYLNDAIGRSGIKYICMHNEQALAMAAEAYARITGKPSVCIVTSGPGGTNAITGLYGAYVDSVPVIFISGQVRTEIMKHTPIRQIGDQEINITDVVQPLTKMAAICMKPAGITDALNYAIHVANLGRPGPVWIDVPLDVQRAEFVPTKNELGEWGKRGNLNIQVPIIAELLLEAKRPVIIAGSGIRSSRAVNEFWALMKKIQVPTIPSFNARDLGPFTFPTFGMQGSTYCNHLINHSDLILILGCRMNIRQIGWEFGKMGKDAVKIMVDIDPEELNKATFKPNIRVESDVGDFITIMNLVIKEPYVNQWATPPQRKVELLSDQHITPYGFIQVLNQHTEPKEILVFANGTYPTVGIQYAEIKPGMRLICNSGCGAMGYGLPAAIGAAFASGRRVICLEGDGSLQLNIQELQTVVHHRLPIKLFVGNNGGYLSIKTTQDNYFEGFHVGADARTGVSFPDLRKIAAAYGIRYVSANRDTDLFQTIDWMLRGNDPAICELQIDPEFRYEKGEI